MAKEIDMSVTDTVDLDAIFAQFLREQLDRSRTTIATQSSENHTEVISK